MKKPRSNPLLTDTPTTRLVFVAGLSGLIYLVVFTLPFPLPRFYQTIPPVDYAKLTHYSLGGFIAYVAGISALFVLYVAAIQFALPPARIPARLIFAAGAGLALILLFAYPVTAIDLFIYAIRTRGWALYGLNPLATAPEMLPPADPWLGLAAEWGGAPSPYGPAWEWLSLGGFYLAGGSFLGHLLVLKFLAGLAYLGSAGLVYLCLARVRPAWAPAGTIAFAWNPLTLLESIQNGHNDIWLVFFLLLAAWSLGRRPGRVSLPAGLAVCLGLALSILVKFVTLLVAPFFLLELARRSTEEQESSSPVPWRAWVSPRRWVFLLGYGLVTGLLVAGPMALVWPGWDTWAVREAGAGAGRSLLALLVLSLRGRLGTNGAFDLARTVILVFFALIYLYHLGQFMAGAGWRSGMRPLRFLSGLDPSFPAALLPSFHVLFWYVLVVVPVFHAWYLLWFLPLAILLLPRFRPLLAAVVFGMTGLLIIPYFETIRVWVPVLLDNPWLGHLLGVPLLIGPPAFALWGRLDRQRVLRYDE